MKKLLLALLACGFAIGIAQAATFTVNNTNNTGAGSLRQAIADANTTPGADVIVFDNALANQTITISSPFLVITSDMTIDGSGAPNLTISGGGTSRIFWIQNGTITIQNLTLANGYAKGGNGGGGGMGAGGAIFMHEGRQDPTTPVTAASHGNVLSGSIDLRLINVTLKNNSALGGNGGLGNSGGGGMGGSSTQLGGGGVLGNGAEAGGSITNASGSTAGNNGGIAIFGFGGTETGATKDKGGFGGGAYRCCGGFGGGGGGSVDGGGSFGIGGFGGGGGGAGTDNNFLNNGGANGGYGGGGGGLQNRCTTCTNGDAGGMDGNPGFGGGKGTTHGGGGMGAGGAIFVASGKLTLQNVAFENNTATGGTGGNNGKGYGGALFVFNKADNGNTAAPGTTNDPQVIACGVTYTNNSATDDLNNATNNDNIYGSIASYGPFANGIIYVKANAAGSNNGTSWTNAFTSLQDALSAACNCGGGEIWVARGTYIPSVALAIDDVNGIETREKTFQLCEGVKVYGGFAGTETQLNERNITANVTILSGDLGNDDTDANNDDIIVATDIIGDNAYHVVYTNGVTNATVLDGFTITAGNATSFDGNQNNLFGAGMLNINNSAPTVNNCTFTGNNGVQGGGMGNRNSAPQVNYCKFINNLASGLLQGFTFGAGAGMSNDDSNPVLFACTFDGNEAKGFYAGAISSYGGSVTATNCVFSANKSKSSGGAFYCEGTNHTLTNCIFIGNMAGVGGFGRGGALSLSVGRQNFVNCLFAGNSAPDDGGAIAMDQFDNSSLINCTISGNKAGGSGGGIYMVEFLATPLTNCIIWNNQDNTGTNTVSSSISQSDGTLNISYSLIDNSGGSGGTWQSTTGTDGGNNKDVDPLFVTPVDPGTAPTTAGDLRLLPASPAINMGNNTPIPVDAKDVDGDSDLTEPTPDLDGEDRILQSTVDMGAYEQLSCPSGSNLTLYVNTAAADGGDGLSWNTAYNKLQDALYFACNCGNVSEIWVAKGTYYPDEGSGQTDNDRNSTFQLCNNIKLYGGFAGGETLLSERNVTANVTILSGDIDGDDLPFNPDSDDDNDASTPSQTDHIRGNNAYHVVTGSGTNNTAVLDGFTITAGNGVDGAGMYNASGSPTVRNCIFSGNTSSSEGGGMFNGANSSPTVSNCIFSGNNATFGGGMSNGGINSSPTIINCSFLGNTAILGGGMANGLNSSPTIINCSFSGNSVISGGGGMYNFSTSPTVTNCTFSGNTASLFGGGMFNADSSPSVNNCIIWNNEDNSGIGTANASVFNNNGATPIFSHSLIQSSGGSNSWNATIGTDDGNNKDVDPLFVTPVDPGTAPTTAGDLRLQPTSPAINMGDNNAVPADTYDVDDDGNTTEPTPDLDLNDRIVANIVDLGAFEAPCAANAGNITNSFVDAESFPICEGDEPDVIFAASGEQTDATAYSYAFLLVNSGGTILQYNTSGDFTFAGLAPGTYTIYGLSYATFNTPGSVTDYLSSVTTITDIQNDDARNGGALCLDLTSADGETNTVTINQAATVTLNDTYPAICRTKFVDLTQLGANIGGSATSATWSVLEADSDGQFLDTNPEPDVANNQFGTADIFRPGTADAQRGYVTLVLSTNDPDGEGPCEPVSDQVRIVILNVDCGQFPWNGN